MPGRTPLVELALLLPPLPDGVKVDLPQPVLVVQDVNDWPPARVPTMSLLQGRMV